MYKDYKNIITHYLLMLYLKKNTNIIYVRTLKMS